MVANFSYPVVTVELVQSALSLTFTSLYLLYAFVLQIFIQHLCLKFCHKHEPKSNGHIGLIVFLIRIRSSSLSPGLRLTLQE